MTANNFNEISDAAEQLLRDIEDADNNQDSFTTQTIDGEEYRVVNQDKMENVDDAISFVERALKDLVEIRSHLPFSDQDTKFKIHD